MTPGLGGSLRPTLQQLPYKGSNDFNLPVVARHDPAPDSHDAPGSPASWSVNGDRGSVLATESEPAGADSAKRAASSTAPEGVSRAASDTHPGHVEDVYRRCRHLGMRLSRQRRMVLDLLWSEKSHLSARDIFEKLNDLGRNIGHTSVYQNLEALQSAGVIECLERASGRLYGYRADPHSHLTSLDDGSIHDLDVSLPAELLQTIEALTGYRIESYTLQLFGRRDAADT